MGYILFEGVATAVVTPMKADGKIDWEAFERLIEYQAEGGVSAVVVCGTTGESPTVTEAEKKELFSLAVRQSEGRFKVICGCGAPSTEASVRMAAMAEKCGCDGILTVTPYYNKCSTEGLFRHYKAVADTVSLPVIAYNVPSRTGVDISLDAYERLAEIDNLTGIKEASGRVLKTEQIISRFGGRFNVYCGSDELIAPLYSVGAKGVISVLSNVLPRETSELCSLCRAGNMREATHLQLKLFPLIMALFSDVNPIPVKTALAEMGLCEGYMRLPLCEMENGKRSALLEMLRDYL